MAMGLPVIATNWSGNTEFMNAHNSFLIPILGLEPIGDGPFQVLCQNPQTQTPKQARQPAPPDPSSESVRAKS